MQLSTDDAGSHLVLTPSRADSTGYDFDPIAVVLVHRCTHGQGRAATSIPLPLNYVTVPIGGLIARRNYSALIIPNCENGQPDPLWQPDSLCR